MAKEGSWLFSSVTPTPKTASTTTTTKITTTVANNITSVVSSGCMVKEIESGLEKTCVFPFKIKDDGIETTHNTCTDIFDDDGRFWCSTKVFTYSAVSNK